MNDKAVQHTLNIFKQVYRNLPPLVDESVGREMKEKIEEITEDGKVTLEELENFMIFYGKQIWPFVQAFEDIYHVYHEKLSEKIFLAKASKGIIKKYHTIKETGVKFLDIFRGSLHNFFSHEERVELMDLLISLKQDIRKHAAQAVLTHEKGRYEEKVEKYGIMVNDINRVIQDLHKFANEADDNDLSLDVRDKVRAIEYSLAFLGPKISYHEILNLPEYYIGKKQEKKMRRII
ncbi:MAG: hypothetical protein COX80_04475 [Candidatus Magasanikbacteria bacterium CG_4_10_14_0_2_um_filter_33_14]|uniref:Uncharacterized protein n=1 Tax=Candidatus Magasanikbacteria bacterium CG_4_10_14_0_2_um_filter_33_14 TaxID=1974636 RepID=A0A2M7V9B4_9BACT|nr:MAG: hypothetical protein COX80_04475 [Candidatus Magasanikbacteria bacterium CG_4_10_14_0_2_um_filter_33_14]